MMKQTLTTLISLFILTTILHAQPGFEKVYGGNLADWFRCAGPTSDGGIIAGGGTRSFGFGNETNWDGYIVKMNNNGDTIWSRSFGETPNNDEAYSILENSQGYLVAGWNVADTPQVSYDYCALQYDVNGNLLWEKFYGTPSVEYCNAAITDIHGRTVLCGGSNGFFNAFDVYAVKLDANGNKLIDAHFGGWNHDYANGICQTSDGGYAMVGYTITDLTYYDIYVVKTDSNFQFEWAHNYGSPIYDDFGYDITQDANGNLWIVGALETLDSSHVVLIETDSLGENAVMKFPGTSHGDFGYHIHHLSDGGFLIGGVTATIEKGNEMLLEKLDANGDTLWTKHFGGAQNEAGIGVTTDADNNILLAGETEGFGMNQFDAYLVKLDSAGDVPCPASVSFVSAPSPACEDELISFTNTTISSQPFTWSESGNNFSAEVNSQKYFPAAGTFDITLAACNVSSSQNIIINPKPATHFTYTSNGTLVSFTLDAGITVQDITWNFGDGSPLNTIDNNPSHTYSNPGMYWVILSVTNTNGCDSTYIGQILITGIDELTTNSLLLFPNPAHASVMLQTSSATLPLRMLITDMQGKVIKEIVVKKNQEQISLNNFSPGIYLLELQDNYGASTIKRLGVY